MTIRKWATYLSYIPPKKIAGRIVHAVKNIAISYAPNLLLARRSADLALDSDKLANFADVYACMGDRFGDAASLSIGTFGCKGVQKSFGSIEEMSWDNPFAGETEKLHWTHDFAFFSYSIYLARAEEINGMDAIARLVQTLESKHPLGAGKLHFVWSPIALSLRIMALSTATSLALRRSSVEPGHLTIISNHIQYCRAILEFTIERYLGYNHQVFGEVALAVASMAAGDDPQINEQCRKASQAIQAHILDDGFWSERSPTYHIHMLLLARCLLASEGVVGIEKTKLEHAVRAMSDALTTVVHSDNEIAIFNDSAIGDSVRPTSVGWKAPSNDRWNSISSAAGYAQLRLGDTSLIFDAGEMGPNDVIGHGHGDFLSVEVCWHGKRLLVDPGVRSITGGEERHLTRSASLHNGPTYIGLEPAEFFGTWRVGRRGRAEICDFTDDSKTRSISGWNDGYARYTCGGKLKRTVSMDNNGNIRLSDTWPSNLRTMRRVSLLIPAEWEIVEAGSEQISIRSDHQVVYITLENASLESITASQWNPYGPISPRKAHRIIINASTDKDMSSINIRH